MKKSGISPQEFADRLMSVSDIAVEWPFGHMPSADISKKYSLPDTVPQIPDGNSILRMSILAVAPGCVTLSAEMSDSYVQYATTNIAIGPDPEATNVWQQMRGLKLALDITSRVNEHKQTTSTLNRILGVEQPLRTPSRNNIFPTSTGNREQGYIHGTVVGLEVPEAKGSAFYNAKIRLGRERRLAELVNIRSLVVTRSAVTRKNMLMVQEGDLIRATVSRHFNNPQTFAQQGDIIHVLNN